MNTETTHVDKKPNGICYEPGEVAYLWQSWANRRRTDYNPDTLKRPGTRDTADPRLRAWLWVESFFVAHPVWCESRRIIIDGNPVMDNPRAWWLFGVPPDDLLAAWGAWYKEHPLRRQLSADDVQSVNKDFLPITIAEACEELKCSRDSLQKAAKHGALFAWRPKGMVWHTNRYWLTKWKAENPHGGARVRAA